MIKNVVILLLFNLLYLSTYSQDFEKYFYESSLRIDYIHTANHNNEIISYDEMFHEPFWGGSKVNLIDTFDYGYYKYEVFDFESGEIIYSRAFNTLCEEWMYTDEAKNIYRSFSETIIIPYPKEKIKIYIHKREKDGKWSILSERNINPKDYMIKPQKDFNCIMDSTHYVTISSKALDIVILAEGYTIREIEKFKSDAKRFSNYLFGCKPFDEFEENINIWALAGISEESGTDIPGDSIYKNTLFDSHFYTFGEERYLNTLNNKQVRNIASQVPYDQIYILVNTDKYGGSGIFNYYSICTSDHKHSNFVFVHEFGHSFAALSDEYYTSSVAVEDYYDLNCEPWTPNLTTLVDFDSKWKHLLDKNTPIPTPAVNENIDKIGVYEGGGYVEKGIYRPKIECTMKSVRYNDFCPVCNEAIVKMLMFYIN